MKRTDVGDLLKIDKCASGVEGPLPKTGFQIFA
jgi:hypothetical protein